MTLYQIDQDSFDRDFNNLRIFYSHPKNHKRITSDILGGFPGAMLWYKFNVYRMPDERGISFPSIHGKKIRINPYI
jgi:hypothetical protein